jgi:hypothetical protein
MHVWCNQHLQGRLSLPVASDQFGDGCLRLNLIHLVGIGVNVIQLQLSPASPTSIVITAPRSM